MRASRSSTPVTLPDPSHPKSDTQTQKQAMETTAYACPTIIHTVDIRPLPLASQSAEPFPPSTRAELARLEAEYSRLVAEVTSLSETERHNAEVMRVSGHTQGTEWHMELLDEVGKCRMQLDLIETRLCDVRHEHARVQREAVAKRTTVVENGRGEVEVSESIEPEAPEAELAP